MKTRATAACLTALTVAAQAQAVPNFQGRLANGTPSSTCAVSGAGKCTSFYDAALDITILNNWNIGQGVWSATAAAGSAQALAASAGFAATGLTGWVLPTADASQPNDGSLNPLNQYRNIWYAAGGFPSTLPLQFDGVQTGSFYFSSSITRPGFGTWVFNSSGAFMDGSIDVPRLAVAIRAGDVAAVPEPQTWLMLLGGLAAVAVAWKRRRD